MKRNSIILIKFIPIVSVIISYIYIFSKLNNKSVTLISTLISFFGFVFYFFKRKEYASDKVIKTLGMLDICSTILIILLYIASILSFGL